MNFDINMDEQKAKLLEEAVDFFTSNPGYTRLIQGIIKKYQSLARWGGSVTLTSLTNEEKESLSTFFRQDYGRKQSVTISLKGFAKVYAETRYGEIPLMILLEKIYGEPIVPYAETAAQKEKAKEAFFAELENLYTDDYSRFWLKAIKEKEPGTRQVHLLYEKSPAILSEYMLHVLRALGKLSERSSTEFYRLPLFAREVTKDPHGFDPDTEQGRLLISALKLIANIQSSTISAEELTELFFSFGILRDDITNYVTCTGITATLENGHKPGYLMAACDEQVVLNLPLREIVKFAKVIGEIDSVFIVENSGVFSTLLDYLEEFRQENQLYHLPNPPLICTHGQFKLASILLLDKLALSGAIIYYSGDFDPEGLLLVDRLLKRYPNQVIPWRYGLEEYKTSLSDQYISDIRLKKLEGVMSAELVSLKEEINRTSLAGYQEGIIELLWQDIREMLLNYRFI